MSLEKLKQILAESQISQSPEDLEHYGKDWTKHFTPQAQAVVFPGNENDVVKIVQWANTHKVALVPSGGRTGLSAAAFATNNEVVVSFEKMNKILDFDEIDLTVTCEPGVITEALQNFAKDNGYMFPVDFAAAGSSQIGGNIATNAGGIKVLRYGLFRDWVVSLRVVTGKGEVLHLNKSLVKNATGYDFRHLFIGSEGTLGFVTQATLKLTTPAKDTRVLLLALKDLDALAETYKQFKNRLPLIAFEMFGKECIAFVENNSPAKMPISGDSPFYVVCEFEDGVANEETAAELLEKGFEEEWLQDGVLAQSSGQAKELWAMRENISESISVRQPYKNDISVRISRIPEFLKALERIVTSSYPDFEVIRFGHIGDGNLHVNILKPQDMNSDEFMKKCKEVDQKMFAMIETLEGSVSAEHGVGLVKKNHLQYTRSLEEVVLMKGIKQVFDPNGIMNPGKIFDL